MITVLLIVVCLLSALSAPAQPGAIVDVYPGLSKVPVTQLLFRDGSGNTEYICYANADQPNSSWSRATGTITSIAVATNVGTVTIPAHGLAVGNLVTITGATVDADLNGTYYVQTVPGATTFTITTASVADGTYVEATLVLTTNAPLDTASIWGIMKLSYTGALIDRVQVSPYNSICANRAVTTGPTKVTYR